MNPIYRRRRRNDVIIRLLCLGAAIFGVAWLAMILFTLFYNGLAGLSLQVFTQNTPPPGWTRMRPTPCCGATPGAVNEIGPFEPAP